VGLAAGDVEGREAAIERDGLAELQHQLGGTGGEPPAPGGVGRLGHGESRADAARARRATEFALPSAAPAAHRPSKTAAALPVCPRRGCSHARGMSPRWLLFFLGLSAATAAPADRQTVIIEPAKTSIYIGSITMTMPPFTRVQDCYESTYAAKVFPYFFYNEHGRLAITFTDEQLERLARGERVEFKGAGRSSDGEDRRIEGAATPVDATGGKIKVRVFISKKIELIFNTAYHFAPAPQ
jgi:hypothetical protein